MSEVTKPAARAELRALLETGGAAGAIVFKDQGDTIAMQLFLFKNESSPSDVAQVAMVAAGLYSIGASKTGQQLADAVDPVVMTEMVSKIAEDYTRQAPSLDVTAPVAGRE